MAGNSADRPERGQGLSEPQRLWEALITRWSLTSKSWPWALLCSPACPEIWGLCFPVQHCHYCRLSWGCFDFPTTKGTSRHKGKKLWVICWTQPTVKDNQLIRTADTASLLSSLAAVPDPGAGPCSQLPLNIWEGHQLTFCLCLFPLVNNRLNRVKLSS